jgi:hypothetical protein
MLEFLFALIFVLALGVIGEKNFRNKVIIAVCFCVCVVVWAFIYLK